MGLSIHYSGNILSREMIDPLIEEVSDISKIMGWEFHVFNDEDIKGVSFAPKKSEPVFLTFNPDGKILSAFNIICKDIYDDVTLKKEWIFTASTKTQFAGIEAHIAIIDFLKHLSKKYMKDFTLFDEGNYWETGDKQILSKQFSKYEAALDLFCESLSDMSQIPGENAESLAERLERILREKFGGEKNESE